MSLGELIERLGDYQSEIAIALLAVPVLALLLGLFVKNGKGNEAPWKYFYSVLVYAACIPGLGALLLTLYQVIFLRESVLDVNAVVYLLPIVTSIVALGIMSRRVDFTDLPGFGRLSGLMVMVGLSFLAVFVLDRTRIWLFFGGGIRSLIILGAFAFALFK